MPRRTPTPNPLTSGPPPRYVFGGLGVPQMWTYRGRALHLSPRAHGAWKVQWDEPTDEGERDFAIGESSQDALGRARYKIDLYELGEPWAPAAKGLDHVIDDMGLGPINSGTVARAAEIRFQRAIAGEDVRPVGKSHAQAFYALPVTDRIRLIDEVIADQIRVGALAPNPPREVLLAW